MSIYRGAGGAGDAVNDASSEATLVAQLATEAQTSATNAATSATSAGDSATSATTSATSASNSATAAASSASSASSSASTATTQATNAANSATAAQTAETNAETAETNAETAETNAETAASAASSSATTASTAATNASNSASAASTSATNASNSASAASTSASNASTSATNAASSASAASTSASNAATSETNAAASASSASTSASTATTQAGIATTKAGEAATSATNASNSASSASTSATNASNSATAAAGSATTASSAADAALAALDSFDDRYLGQKSTAPTVDNDGNALVAGALYFNTTTNEMKVWDGSQWLNAYASLSGALLATNNLSDLNNTATARTNLGVAIGTNVQAWDADLDTWATKTAPSGTVVGTSDSQTLTNKTLTTPVISSITNTGTITLPTSTDTLVGRATTDTLTNKTIALGNNTVSGTLAQFNTAVTDADFASIAGTETLTNKTLTSPVVTGGSINNTPIGATTANTGAFSNLSYTGTLTGGTGIVNLGSGQFYKDASGNVGIGTSSPSQKFHVVGNSVSTTTTNDIFQQFNSTGGNFYIGIDNSSGSAFGAGAYGRFFYSSGAYPMAFFTNATERMRIDSAGNVGIGTSSPVSIGTGYGTLDVRGSAGGGYRWGNSTDSAYTYSDSTSTVFATATSKPMTFGTNNTERMRIASSGHVIVGHTAALGTGVTPNMQVKGTGASNFGAYGLITTNNEPAGLFGIYSNGENSLWIASDPDNLRVGSRIVFSVDGSDRASIDAGGNLLVAKTTAVTPATVGVELGVSGYGMFTRASDTPLFVNRNTNDGELVSFRQDNTQEGTISVSGTTVSYNGGHLSRWSQLPDNSKDDTILKGTVLTNLDDMCVWTKDGELLTNEQLNKMKVSDVEGDTNVAGVFVNWTRDEDCNSDDMNIAMTGDMIIRIADGVVVQKGDLLMSAGDGTAKSQGDDIVRSKTIAKVTSNHVTCTYADGSYCVPCVLMAC